VESSQKATWVEKQLQQVTLGNLVSIACPYCGADFAPGTELCCGPMGDAMAAFLHRMEAMDFAERGRATDPDEAQLNTDVPVLAPDTKSVQ